MVYHSHLHGDRNGYAHGDGDFHGIKDANRNQYTDLPPNTHARRHRHGDPSSDADALSHEHSNPDRDRDTTALTDRDEATPPDATDHDPLTR